MRARRPETARTSTVTESVVIDRELGGDCDLVVEGRVDGVIKMPASVVTVREQAEVNADITARVVVVSGTVRGNIRALERVDLRDRCTVMGDVRAPRVTTAPHGVNLRGAIELRRWGRKLSAGHLRRRE